MTTKPARSHALHFLLVLTLLTPRAEGGICGEFFAALGGATKDFLEMAAGRPPYDRFETWFARGVAGLAMGLVGGIAMLVIADEKDKADAQKTADAMTPEELGGLKALETEEGEDRAADLKGRRYFIKEGRVFTIEGGKAKYVGGKLGSASIQAYVNTLVRRHENGEVSLYFPEQDEWYEIGRYCKQVIASKNGVYGLTEDGTVYLFHDGDGPLEKGRHTTFTRVGKVTTTHTHHYVKDKHGVNRSFEATPTTGVDSLEINNGRVVAVKKDGTKVMLSP